MIPGADKTQAFNRYMYVLGNPVRYYDRSGNYSEDGPGAPGPSQSNPNAGSATGPGAPSGDHGGSGSSKRGAYTACVGGKCHPQPAEKDFVNASSGSGSNGHSNTDPESLNDTTDDYGNLTDDNGTGSDHETNAIYNEIVLPIGDKNFRGFTDLIGAFQHFRSRSHTGWDLIAPEGTNVLSVIDGKIIFAGRYGNYGKTIIVQDEDGYKYITAHLKQIFVKKGRVTIGQIIGLS